MQSFCILKHETEMTHYPKLQNLGVKELNLKVSFPQTPKYLPHAG